MYVNYFLVKLKRKKKFKSLCHDLAYSLVRDRETGTNTPHSDAQEQANGKTIAFWKKQYLS